MNRASAGVVAAVLIAACGGGKSSDHTDESVHAKFRGLADRACGCTTKVCTQLLRPELDAFGAQLAKDRFDANTSLQKSIDANTDRFEKCVARIESPVAPKPVEPARPVEPAEPVKPVEPRVAPRLDPTKLGASANNDVLEMLGIVRTAVSAIAPDIALAHLRASYVRKDGTLDPKYGTLELELSLPDVPDGLVDDPDRPTGAPIPSQPRPVERATETCPTVTFTEGAWKARFVPCRKKKWIDLRCSLVAVWERAIKRGAPEKAVAIVTVNYLPGYPTPTWFFTIKDDVRKVDFKTNFPDDCEARPADKMPAKPATP